MAVSIASTLTPYLWKGEPTVVVRGKFVLGLVTEGSHAYFAPNLYLDNLAAAVTGKTFSLQVLGRAVSQGQSEDGPAYGGIAAIDNGEFTYQMAYNSGDLPVDPYSLQDGPGPHFVPKAYCRTALSNYGYNLDSLDEGNAFSSGSGGSLGTLVCPDLRIVLRGALSRLDVTKIRAAGFPPSETTTLRYTIETTAWSLNYKYSGFDGYGVGWRATDVHVYDNPALRGNVTAGDVPVIWD